jgi:glycolate oxidase FAD binding subunit
VSAVDGVLATRVHQPADVDEVCRIVAAARDRGEALVASGLGRHLDVGAPPSRLDALLRLDRLDRVLAYEPADMTVTVEAGCTLSALGRTLAQAGQWLPIDPPCPEQTTVGGLVAANLSGPLRASQGTVRDSLLGIAVVGDAGVVHRGGGRVVKNVAGYDLPKVHVGALGTLGIVVEATFKVRPRFASEAAVAIEVPDLAVACDLALRLRDAIEPSWLEVVHPASQLGPELSGSVVVVGAGGAPAWVEEACARVMAVVAGYRTTRHADGAALRGSLATLLVRPAAAIVRIATLATEVASFVVPALHALERSGVAVDLTVHAANGVSRLGVGRADQVGAVLDHLRARAPEGVPVVLERATPAAKAGLDVWGGVRSGQALMAGIKRAFDPAAVFAPGRFVAGL